MAYINFKLLAAKEITPTEYLILQCCKQMRFEDVSETMVSLCGDQEEPILSLEDRGLVQQIKAGKTLFQRMRLSKKGQDLMDDIETPEVTEEDIVIWNWLASIYKKKDKQLGNQKKGKLWLAQFRVQSGIDKNCLAYLCNTFIKDPDRMEFSVRLDYVFFKPPNIHSVRFDLEESKLWQYYLINKKEFDEKFEEIRSSSR